MGYTLDKTNGVGLAAPQVGLNLNLFITRIPESCTALYQHCKESPLKVWINQKYKIINSDELFGIESCLSIPKYVGIVSRPTEI